MYKEVFNFTSRPFTAAPYVKHYFASESMQQTLTKAQDCIERAAGPVVAIGGPGSGKSLLLGMLEEKYRSKFGVANLTCVHLQDRADLLRSILFTLDQPHQGMSEGDLRFSLINYLKPNSKCPNGVLLLVDDAQTLGLNLLDEIRLITNFVRDGQPRVRLVLAGTQTLEENLGASKLQSLNQRIAARCYLTSMRRAETANYVAEHINRAGGNGSQLFDAQSLRAVHEVSDGCPRLVNQVCEHALIVASTCGARTITEDHVREAWDDVQGIPGDWSAPANIQQDTSALKKDDGWTVIEFGQLEDEESSESTGTVYDFENSEGEASSVDDTPRGIPVEAATSEQAEENPVEPETPPVAQFQTQPGPAPNFETDSQPQPEPVTQFTPQPAERLATAEQEPIAQADPEPTVEQIAAANGVTLRQPVETVDPFEESFAEEEHLQDRFAPVVAHQNQASLDVTAADLEAIKPEQDPAPQRSPQAQALSGGDSVEQNQSTQPTASAVTNPLVQVLGVAQPRKPQAAQAAQAQPAPVETPPPVSSEALETKTSQREEPKNNRDEIVDNAEEIERQAEEILERLRLSTVSHETNKTASSQAEADAIEERQARELDESQKVLEEILSQKSILEEARNQTAEPIADVPAPGPSSASEQSVNLEYPMAQPNPAEEPRRDDSEMLIVSRMEQKMESPKPKPEPIPFPQTPVSKGNAQRMDYQQLFDQLRDISRDQV